MAITVTNTGYIKRTAITNYRISAAAARGASACAPAKRNFVSHLFVASTHAVRDDLLGPRPRLLAEGVTRFRTSVLDGRGKAIANLVSMQEGERIARC
jgi:DNA gyrase subunit A